MNKIHHSRRGFTIVELLIVIVVIGILAAITIVAYNGIQTRARNVQTINAVKAYQKSLALYALDNNSYPGGTTTTSCLGTYTIDLNGDGTPGECEAAGSTIAISYSATINNALAAYNGQRIVSPAQKMFVNGTSTGYGIVYYYNPTITLEGVSYPWWILYTQEGIGSCQVGPVASLIGGPNRSMTSPSGGYSQTWGNDAVRCWLPLPDPVKA